MNAPCAFAPPLPLAGEGRGEGARQKQAATLIQQALIAIKNLVLLAAYLLLPSLCAAQSAPSPQDIALLAGNCVTCHGPGGQPPAGADNSIPALRGQTAARLLERMQAFQAGQVADATVMPLLMQGYDAAQLQALARWFARPAEQQP